MSVARSSNTAVLSLDSGQGRWVLFAAVLGSGMAMIDGTVVNVALPTIGRDLSASLAGLQWTITGYTLTLAAFVLLGGSLGDRYGRRRIFVIGVTWFALTSLLCGLAPSIELLVAGRVLQGVGGALLTPGSLAIISASFVPQDRGRAIGAWSGLGGIAAAIGPFLGGWLIGIDWHLVFLVNIPLALLTIAVAVRHVPESLDPQASRRLDLTGAGLGVIGLGGVTAGLIEAREDPRLATMAGLIGVLAMAGFVLTEIRSKHPMMPVSIFASRQFTATNLVTFGVYAALGGILFLLVVDLQVVGGYSALAAGTALLPMTLLMLVLSSRAGDLGQRIGPRLPMTLGPVISGLGTLWYLNIGPDANYLTQVLPGVVIFGLGLSLTVAPLTTTVLAAAPEQHAGIASGVNNAVARAGGLIAVAVLPVITGLQGEDYQEPAAFAAAFRIAVLICSGLLIGGGVLSWLTIRNAPAVPLNERTHCALDAPPLSSASSPTPASATG